MNKRIIKIQRIKNAIVKELESIYGEGSSRVEFAYNEVMHNTKQLVEAWRTVNDTNPCRFEGTQEEVYEHWVEKVEFIQENIRKCYGATVENLVSLIIENLEPLNLGIGNSIYI